MIPMTTNHKQVIGPKKVATLAVPRDWTATEHERMTMVIGRTKGFSAGAATSRPSTAESTESAGVMTAFP